MDSNLKREEIEGWNKDILEPDIYFTLDGPRLGGIETVHKFENSGEWERCKQAHLAIARELGWRIVSFNKAEGEEEIKKETKRVAMEIVKASKPLLERRKII